MISGRAAVFISCSEQYKLPVAYAFRNAIQEEGWKPIIVSDEPKLVAAWTPEEKINEYLNRSDMFLALCTPDDKLQNGTLLTRQNIIDEIARTRSSPHLRDRVCIIKEKTVSLPSNLDPVYEQMDLDNIRPAIETFLTQAAAWGFRPQTKMKISSSKVVNLLDEWDDLFLGIIPGEPHKAYPKMRQLLPKLDKPKQHELIDRLLEVIESNADWDKTSVACYLLEATAEIDPGLIQIEILDRLSRHDDFSVRMQAALILFYFSCSSPGTVPIDLLSRLAKPGSEDWYVYTASINALKQLSLTRPEAISVLDNLGQSSDRDEREAAASALLDVARVRPAIVPLQLARRLASDPDHNVAEIGEIRLDLESNVVEEEREHPFSLFTPF